MIRLRPTLRGDLDFVIAAERDPQNTPFIGQWSREQHESALSDPDIGHFIIERESGAKSLGYLIALDVRHEKRELNLKRIVVAEKQRGTGRAALRALRQLAAARYGALQIWLVVHPDNAAARRAYRLEGYRESDERTAHGRIVMRLALPA